MTATPTRTDGGLKLLGLGALACVGCCAGPVLAFLGGLSVAGLASTALLGGVGLVVAAVAAIAVLVVRQRRTLACGATAAERVPVAAPVRRGTDHTEEVRVP